MEEGGGGAALPKWAPFIMHRLQMLLLREFGIVAAWSRARPHVLLSHLVCSRIGNFIQDSGGVVLCCGFSEKKERKKEGKKIKALCSQREKKTEARWS